MVKLVITPGLRLTLQLLAEIDPEYVSDLLLSLIAYFNEEDHIDPDDMPNPVRAAYLFWRDIKRRNQITEI